MEGEARLAPTIPLDPFLDVQHHALDNKAHHV